MGTSKLFMEIVRDQGWHCNNSLHLLKANCVPGVALGNVPLLLHLMLTKSLQVLIPFYTLGK